MQSHEFRFQLTGLAIAAGAVLSFGSQGAIAQVESNYTCFAIDDAGRVIDLESMCRQPQVAAESGDQDTDAAQAFLDALANTASPESLAIADAIGNDNVLALGTSMCDFLATGASPDDLAIAFSATSLPPVFVQDVSAAAINNLCAASDTTL